MAVIASGNAEGVVEPARQLCATSIQVAPVSLPVIFLHSLRASHVLWYMVWLETRVRFLVALFGILALRAFYTFQGDRVAPPHAGLGYYYGTLHDGMSCRR